VNPRVKLLVFTEPIPRIRRLARCWHSLLRESGGGESSYSQVWAHQSAVSSTSDADYLATTTTTTSTASNAELKWNAVHHPNSCIQNCSPRSRGLRKGQAKVLRL